jgi:uncharacterized small protein (DUF1192 family)
MLIDYENFVPRIAIFREEVAKALAEVDLDVLTIRTILVKKKIVTKEEMDRLEGELRQKNFSRLEKENLIRIEAVDENR